MIWLLGGYMWLFVHRPFEVWPWLGELQIERVYMILTVLFWAVQPNKRLVPNRIHAAFAVVGVAALVELDGGRIRRSALAVTGVAPTAIRASAAEQVLAGAAADDTARAAAEAARAAVDGLTPAGDLHASPQTRLALARTYLRRGIELAVSRARNER